MRYLHQFGPIALVGVTTGIAHLSPGQALAVIVAASVALTWAREVARQDGWRERQADVEATLCRVLTRTASPPHSGASPDHSVTDNGSTL